MATNILVVNCGSSSLKFQLINMLNDTVLAKGKCEKIKLPNSVFEFKCEEKGTKFEKEVSFPTHTEALQAVLTELTNPATGPIADLSEITAVGHRAVHGGEIFKKSTIITDEVVNTLIDLSPLAPLHNPACVVGINVCRQLLPTVPHIAVFDTAFHQTMPDYAYLYALPYSLYTQEKIRRYGFHGTSYSYVVKRFAEVIGKKVGEVNCIICHLGAGASMCAIKNGVSIDTTMGFTPGEGLVMGTRAGDLDSGIVTYLNKKGLTADQVSDLLNKESGLQGIAGISDSRELCEASRQGNDLAVVARKIQNYRIRKYIGAYMAAIGEIDAVVFTGGIGENNVGEREMILSGLQHIGIDLDKEKNREATLGKEQRVTSAISKIPVWVIPTNEELEIAKETIRLI
ncbi:MAG: acetate kinase [Clostridia bacterium]